MKSRNAVIAMLLSLLAPFAAAAQTTDKPAEKPADKAEAAAPAPAPAAPPAAPAAAPPAAKPPAVTFEFGGWLILNTWWNSGSFNAADLPRNAAGDEDEKASGFAVRQSRLRAGVNVPSGGGILGNPALKGFVEVDFGGGYAASDEAQPLLRLRHAYATATWKERGNLTLLAGQTNDIFHGQVGAVSLAHLATPRFSGAGYLHRRTPQVRLSGEIGKDVAIGWTVGALSPYDKFTPNTSNPMVGYRAVVPNFEARLAFLLRGASRLKVELGVGGRYGQEKYLMADSSDETVKSRGAAADLKVEFEWLTLVGGAYFGENLDSQSSIAPGVQTTSTATGVTPAGLLTVKSVPTKGGWGQLQLTPVKGLQLLAGAGMEQPDEDFLAASTTTSPGGIKRNLQISGGAIVNLTSKWRAGVEYTRYETKTMDDETTRASQLEVSTLLAF